MKIVTIRTDKPEAELGLYDGGERLEYINWQAHRQLAETIHTTLKELLERRNVSIRDITGVVCFAGPGSFTGLRIGITVGNALAEGLSVPVVAARGETWQVDGVTQLQAGKNDGVVVPEYGAPVHITAQKK